MRGIGQEVRVGRFELLDQRDGVVELAELEHVADRGGRPLGLLRAGLDSDGEVDQGAEQEDRRRPTRRRSAGPAATAPPRRRGAG